MDMEQYSPEGLYFEVGTHIRFTNAMQVVLSESISEGFGLEILAATGGFEGTISKPGEITYSTGIRSITFYAVQSYDDLVFESDPSDGILIPPNHHLVRFLDTDGTCMGYDVVKHGWTAIAPEGYGSSFWTIDDESGTSIYDMDSIVESDIELTLFSGKSIFVSDETIEIATGRGGFEVDTIGGVTWTATVSDPTIVSISISDGYVDIQGIRRGSCVITIHPSIGDDVEVVVDVVLRINHEVVTSVTGHGNINCDR